jgi:hypothetical protein
MGGGGGWYPSYPPYPCEPEPVRGPPRDKKGRFIPKSQIDGLAIDQYNNLRFTCHELEELISVVEDHPDWSEKDLKRLDKAVTVMKVGFKIMKKVLKSRAKRSVHQMESA